jgi:hypothetical protein
MKERLALRSDRGDLPPDLLRAVEERSVTELQRILMARAQLHQIERLAAGHGLRVVVLKGGLAALSDSGAVDLVDVDVLSGPDDARTLARLLDESGYAGEGFSSTQHLRSRVRAGALMIEVHQALEVGEPPWSAGIWDRIVRIPGSHHLLRLAPMDHLWHLLYHVGVIHPYRRSALRDLLVTGNAVAECAEADLQVLTERLERLPHRKAVADLLAMARELASGDDVCDRFERLAVELTVLRNCMRFLPLSGQPQASVGISAAAVLSGWPDVRREWARVRMRTIEGSASQPIAWFERLGPRIGRGVRMSVRVVRTAMAMLVALPIAAGAAVVSYRLTRARGSRGGVGAQP